EASDEAGVLGDLPRVREGLRGLLGAAARRQATGLPLLPAPVPARRGGRAGRALHLGVVAGAGGERAGRPGGLGYERVARRSAMNRPSSIQATASAICTLNSSIAIGGPKARPALTRGSTPPWSR